MRKTIKKARTMPTEINGTFYSMKHFSLNFRKFFNRTAFSEINEFRGRFPFDKIKIPVSISGISMGEWYRLFQCEKQQAEQLCSLNLKFFNDFMFRFKSQTEHSYVDIVAFYTPQQRGPYTNHNSSKTALY